MFFPFRFKTLGNILLWGVFPLLVGWWLSQFLIPRPAIGLIKLNTDIWSDSAELVRSQIAMARQDPAIKGVVVQIDSPGGEVAASQTIFLELQTLRREMPVVGVIDSLAASGGFYAAMGTDPIYATPSAIVGNVGAFGSVPPEPFVSEFVLASGPFKQTYASNREEFLRSIEEIKQEFLATVFNQRGDRLTISAVELSKGLAYSGRDAVNLGLIDAVGNQTEAIATAAQMAGVTNYQVVDLQERVFLEEAKTWSGAADAATGKRHLPNGIYLLYNAQPGGVQ